MLTLGSLFDGIGGFPLAASRCGITPVWASEIEPFPMAVTRERFPGMLHLGDITRIDGAAIPAVDIITGGSPCQDLSVAGKRAGLAGERSGLFMEQIRIIKEMREHDRQSGRSGKHVRPRIMVWENVPGALSSKQGEDFRAVLEETARIADNTVHIPRPPRGKWPAAGTIVGDDYSISWRIMDAQYWGVPQRRRRIFLVADFGGGRAAEVLFEPESLRRDIKTGGEAREAAAAPAGTGVETANTDNCLTPWDVQSRRVYTADGAWPALYAGEGGGHGYVMLFENHGQDSRITGPLKVAPTVSRKYGTGGNNVPLVLAFSAGQGAKAGGIGAQIEVAPTLKASASGTNMVPVVVYPETYHTITTQERNSESARTPNCIVMAIPINDKATRCRSGGPTRNDDGAGLGVSQDGDPSPTISCGDRHAVMVMSTGQANAEILDGLCPTLNCNHEQPIIAGLDIRHGVETGDIVGTLQVPSGGYSLHGQPPVRIGLTVRRLMPVECERLQGFTDGWTDLGTRQSSDTARYKALGNSVAVPCVQYIMRRIASVLGREETTC